MTTYNLVIRRNADGAVSRHSFELDYDPDIDAERFSSYIWLEGNYACDCNRKLFFERGHGRDDGITLDASECGDHGYTLVSVDVDGVRIIENDRTTSAADPDL